MIKHDRKSAREDIFAAFPRGLAVLELANPSDISTWRLLEINALASTLVPPSIETFLSGELLRLVPVVDLPAVYREVLFTRRPRMIGMVERREAARSRMAIGPAPRATGPQVMGLESRFRKYGTRKRGSGPALCPARVPSGSALCRHLL